eukprot:6200197-Pleurochrysis_carterae.AAC.3
MKPYDATNLVLTTGDLALTLCSAEPPVLTQVPTLPLEHTHLTTPLARRAPNGPRTTRERSFESSRQIVSSSRRTPPTAQHACRRPPEPLVNPHSSARARFSPQLRDWLVEKLPMHEAVLGLPEEQARARAEVKGESVCV